MQPISEGTSSSTEGHLPRRLGPYVLLSYLDEGGMGRVYLALARTPGGEQLCVLKRLGNPRSRFSPEQIRENQERFRREAEITMALSHPCIARTFGTVQEGADAYLVQEFVDGMTMDYLTSSLTTGGERFPLPLAAHIATEIARALAYVHDFRGVGLVHRDLTPANVMLAQTGEVKVIDFGIAKATLADDSLTRPHVLVGKPFWTAPEVVAGQSVDRRADLYALGLLLWYLLSGNDPEECLDSASAQLPAPSSFNPQVSAELDRIVAKALHPNPSRRFQSAGEFLDALKPAIPAGYDGPRALARQVFRYESALKKDGIAKDIARARPLLGPSVAAKPRRGRRALALLIVLPAIAGGIYLWSRFKQDPPGSGGGSLPTSPQPPAPPPLPPPPPPPAPPTASSPAPLLGSPSAPLLPPAPRASSRKPPRESSPSSGTAAQPAADELLAAARESFEMESFSEALRLARAAAKQGAGAKAHILIGTCLSIAKDHQGARAAFEQALRLSPGNAEAKRLLDELLRKPPNKTP
jgi:serine/threonine protein kinase